MQNSVKNENMSQLSMSSPILCDTFCRVCQDRPTGMHYGVYTCYPCRYFFKRYLVSRKIYECTGNFRGECIIDSTSRTQCPACRLQRCFKVGMQSKHHTQGNTLMTFPNNSELKGSTYALDSHNSTQQSNTSQAPVLLPATPLGANESLQHIAMEKVSNNIESINGDLQERFRSTSPSPSFALDLRMHLRTLSQEPGLIHSIPLATSESIQDSAAQLESTTTLTAVCASPGLGHPSHPYVLDLRVRGLPQIPPFTSTENRKETTDEHLFDFIAVTKCMRAFLELPLADQLQLINNTFKDLDGT